MSTPACIYTCLQNNKDIREEKQNQCSVSSIKLHKTKQKPCQNVSNHFIHYGNRLSLLSSFEKDSLNNNIPMSKLKINIT